MNQEKTPRIKTGDDDFDSRKLLTLRGRLGLTVEAHEHGLRLDQFLAARLTWRSRTSLEQLIRSGKVELKGRPPRPSRKVRGGEEILVELPRPKRDKELDEHGGSIPLDVLYEDKFLVAIDKPPGVPVHPGGRLLHRTIITELHHRYRVYDDPSRDIVPKLCHRLDLETSGVLLIAKADRIVAEVGRQLRAHETTKEYLAIVHGDFREDDMLVDAPIGNAERSRVHLRRAVRADGAPARTGIHVERRFRTRFGARFGEFTLVRLRLYTGRRHQLRVHLSHLGHPIVGDKLYGLDEDYFLAYYEDRLDAEMRAQLLLPRQALHATRLVLRHPTNGGHLEIESPLPQDLREFLETLQEEDSPRRTPAGGHPGGQLGL